MSDSFVTPWTVNLPGFSIHGISRQEYWSVLPFPSPGDLPNPGNEPMSPAWQVGSLPLSHLGSPKLLLNKPLFLCILVGGDFVDYYQESYLKMTAMGKTRLEDEERSSLSPQLRIGEHSKYKCHPGQHTSATVKCASAMYNMDML